MISAQYLEVDSADNSFRWFYASCPLTVSHSLSGGENVPDPLCGLTRERWELLPGGMRNPTD